MAVSTALIRTSLKLSISCSPTRNSSTGTSAARNASGSAVDSTFKDTMAPRRGG